MTAKTSEGKFSWVSVIERLFAFLGAIATLFSAFIAVEAQSSKNEDADSFFKEYQKTASNILAPSGYSLQPTYIEVASEDEPFELVSAQSIKLTARDREVTLTLTDIWDNGTVSLYLDGVPRDLVPGPKIPIEDTDCLFWLLRIADDFKTASFEVICDG